MIIANMDSTCVRCTGLWQFDYGQILRIQGIRLPSAVEIHFSLDEKGGEATRRIGVTKDDATDVIIPDSMLENNDIVTDYKIYAFIYLSDVKSGRTEYKIVLSVKTRPKPESFDCPEDAALFREAISEVNKVAESVQKNVIEAESWAHGKQDAYPERDSDNAKYYADRARDEVERIPAKVTEGKKEIDCYVNQKKEELKGDTGDVNFAAFRVKNGRLMMYSDPSVDKVRFYRVGSRLKYRLAV